MLRVFGARSTLSRLLLSAVDAGCDGRRAIAGPSRAPSQGGLRASSSVTRPVATNVAAESRAASQATTYADVEKPLLVRKRLQVIYLPWRAVNTKDITASQPGWRRQKETHFDIHLQPLGRVTAHNVDAGPPYLRGNYPPGTLEGRHEHRRVYTEGHSRPSGWRDVEDSESNGGKEETATGEAANKGDDLGDVLQEVVDEGNLADEYKILEDEGWTPLPPSEIGPRLDPTSVPIMVITSKQIVDKRAVVRNKVRTRIVEGLRAAMKSSEPRARNLLALLNPSRSLLDMTSPQVPSTRPENFLKIYASDNKVVSVPMAKIVEQMEKAIDELAKTALPRLIPQNQKSKQGNMGQGQGQDEEKERQLSRRRQFRR